MARLIISEPDTGTSNQPDRYTKEAPDYTQSTAAERVFYINLGFFRYGTKDKAHGASVLLSLFLLVAIVIVIGLGVYAGSNAWLDKVFTWLGSAFLFITGVAVGRNGDIGDKKAEE